MEKICILCMSALLLILAGCDKDDDFDSVIGNWSVSHSTNSPDIFDTCDMWDYSFKSNGTGSSDTGSSLYNHFRYEIHGNHIILHYQASADVIGKLDFEYEIMFFSKDKMEWQEIPDESRGGVTHHLIFWRK